MNAADLLGKRVTLCLPVFGVEELVRNSHSDSSDSLVLSGM